MATEQEKWISIMIVPEDGTGMRKWRVTTHRYSLIKAAFWCMCFFLFVGFISMIALGLMFVKLRRYEQFNKQLLEATSKLHSIAARLDRHEEKEQKLRTILGSDLDLPKPMIVETEPSTSRPSDASVTGRLNELEQAIAEQEAKTRKIPTTWPVDAWQITKEFRNTGDIRDDHHGIDILAPRKSNVVAAAEGKVTFAGEDPRLGLSIVIDHENGWVTKYGHNASLQVKYGDTVRKGELIAIFGGSDGSSTGSHLHFAMYYKGQPVNPLDWLEEKSKLNLSKVIE